MQNVLDEDLQAAVNNSKILVVGCGGIGCELVKILGKYALSLTLVDFDTVELTNLHRQFFFTRKDVGKFKAEVIAHSLRSNNTSLKVICYTKSIFEKSFDQRFYHSFDAVLLALDNEEARSHINRECVRSFTPMFECGTHGFTGQSYPIFPKVSRCYDCYPRPTPRTHQICSVRSRPSKPVHCAVWAMMTLEALLSPNVSEDSALYPSLRGRRGKEQIIESLELIFESSLAQFEQLAEDISLRVLPVKDLLCGSSSSEEKMYLECLTSYLEAKNKDEWIFNKDNPDDIEALEALTQLRGHCFSVEGLRPGDGRKLALNVIPAISSTNSLVAALTVLELFKYLLKRHLHIFQKPCCDDVLQTLAHKEVYVSCLQEPKVLTAYLSAPVVDCKVCGANRLAFRLNFATPVKELLELLKHRLQGELTVFHNTCLVASSEDDEEEANVSLQDLAESSAFLELLLSYATDAKTSTLHLELQHEASSSVITEMEPDDYSKVYEEIIKKEFDFWTKKKQTVRGGNTIARSPIKPCSLMLTAEDSSESVLIEEGENSKPSGEKISTSN